MPNLNILAVTTGILTRTLDLTTLKDLETIDYKKNMIETVDIEYFVGLDKLTEIDFGTNPLRVLPNLCRPGLNLILTDVVDLVCDCSVRYLRYLLPTSEYTPCAQPASMVAKQIRHLNADEFICDTGSSNSSYSMELNANTIEGTCFLLLKMLSNWAWSYLNLSTFISLLHSLELVHH